MVRRKRPARRLALVVAAALAWLSLTAASQGETLTCGAANLGQRSLQAGVRCACIREPGSDEPARYRWDCGILRARSALTIPADSTPVVPLPLEELLPFAYPVPHHTQPWDAR